ncbi:MAG: kynureninase [Actinomycetota bacterium]|nr:kynureninase [Actinomycetota bacterium]
MPLSYEGAQSLDAADPLASFREQFAIGDDPVAYLDGNSLGRPPHSTIRRLQHVLQQEWATGLIREWTGGWAELPVRVGDLLGATVLGAAPGQTVVADSTSVNLFKLLHAAAGLRADRSEIVVAEADFPTDRYLVEAVAAQRGLSVRRLPAHPRGGVAVEDLADVLSDSTAVVVLSQVDYRSGYLADLASITPAVHRCGAVIVWDLSHSAGVVPISLDAHQVDFAVGCTYKYLNAGPGAPAYAYVAQRHLASVEQPIPGWFGAADVFAMADGYAAAVDARQLLSGTPNVLGIVAVEEGLKVITQAGVDAIRAKAVGLTEMVVGLVDDWLVPLGATLQSPRDASLRGGHVTVGVPRARETTDALIGRGIVPDFRNPDMIRFGLSPLTTSYAEAWTALDVLRRLLA